MSVLYNLPLSPDVSGMGAVGLAPEPAESPLVITGVLSWSSSSESETAMALKALGTELLRKEKKNRDNFIVTRDPSTPSQIYSLLKYLDWVIFNSYLPQNTYINDERLLDHNTTVTEECLCSFAILKIK